MTDDAFNGIDARTGAPITAASPAALARLARRAAGPPEDAVRRDEPHFGVVEGIDVCDLSEAGWGVIFPEATGEEEREQAAIVEALQPLLRLRQAQATRSSELLYREVRGVAGWRRGETKRAFLGRHKVGAGPARPSKMPYYLLLVGDPARIPFQAQAQLALKYAVGRLHFERVEDYARYAESVVAAEAGRVEVERRASFVAVANPDDAATAASARFLVPPLVSALSADPDLRGWSLSRHTGDDATRARLAELVNGGASPALLFTASHGLGFPAGDPRQRAEQGALLCQDWPGPRAGAGQPIAREHYFAAEDVAERARLTGTVAFLYACFGAGTPERDEFTTGADRAALAPAPFVAALPSALLSRGGALAVIGHVERAWASSFLWSGARSGQSAQTEAFESAVGALLRGKPVGAAMDAFGSRHGELSAEVLDLVEAADTGDDVPDAELAALWTARNDARGYAILGDPAVRIPGGP